MVRKKPVGIDLGTTRSAIAHITGDDAEVLFNDEGEPVTPSVVTIEDDRNATVGKTALNQAVLKPDRTVQEIKRKMGEDVDVSIGGETYNPEEISALILGKLVEDAENKMNAEVDEAVITIPANFGENQRTATKNAGKIAGIDVKRLMHEPCAACLAYGMNKGKFDENASEIVFVYDLGGGTFDASLVDVDFEVEQVETENTDGVDDVGGADWTSAIAGWISERLVDAGGQDPSENPQVQSQIQDKARDIKHTLSNKEKAPLTGMIGGVAIDDELSREEFNQMTLDLLDETIEATDSLFDRSEFTPDEVDKVLLVGGSTRMPQVRGRVEEYFGMEPSIELNPDRAVAQGAAIQSEILSDSPSEPIIEETDVMTTKVAPHSLGVRLHDGTTTHIIETDDVIPTSERRENFRTVEDNQTIVQFPILEGESEDADNNEKIGMVKLEGIPPRPSTEESLAVEFDLTTDGTLEVEAEDMKTGEAVSATFDSAISRDEEEISKSQTKLPSR